MSEINAILIERLKNLGASQLPVSVNASIQEEVEAWHLELSRKAEARLKERIQRLVTKPFVARHFANQFRKASFAEAPVQEVAHE